MTISCSENLSVIAFKGFPVCRKCRKQMRSWQHSETCGQKTTRRTVRQMTLSVAVDRACVADTSAFCTLNIGLTCSRWVALVNGACTWLTASIRALAVFAICSISTLYSSRLCFSLATPVSNSSTGSNLSASSDWSYLDSSAYSVCFSVWAVCSQFTTNNKHIHLLHHYTALFNPLIKFML